MMAYFIMYKEAGIYNFQWQSENLGHGYLTHLGWSLEGQMKVDKIVNLPLKNLNAGLFIKYCICLLVVSIDGRSQ